jgi:uncharacterized protein YebE (UPF0316 family)
MNRAVLLTFLLIVLARITDVSLGTIRMVSVVQGRRTFAAVLGFFEALVFISVVAKVLLNMNQPIYAIAYGLGFSTGTFLGMVIEQRLAFGKQLVFLLTPKGPQLAEILRAGDYRITELNGQTRDGYLRILCVEIARRQVNKLISIASAVDQQCIVIVNDVRRADVARRIDPQGNKRKPSWFSAPEIRQSSQQSPL